MRASARGYRSTNDMQGIGCRGSGRLRPGYRRRSTAPRSCGRSPTAACTAGPSGRIENTAPAFLAAIDKGYGIECDLQAAKRRHADGVSRRARSTGSWRRRAHRRLLAAAASRACATGATTRHILTLRRVARPRRRARAAAGRGQGQQPARRRGVPRQDRPPGAGPTRDRSRSCPSIATSSPSSAAWRRPSRAGRWSARHQLPPTWWAAPSPVNKSRILTRACCAGARRHRLPRRRRAHAAQRARLDRQPRAGACRSSAGPSARRASATAAAAGPTRRSSRATRRRPPTCGARPGRRPAPARKRPCTS